MRTPIRSALGLTLVFALPSTALAQHALLRRGGDLWPVAARSTALRDVVDRLLAGPTAAEARAGITSAIPGGTRRIALRIDGSTTTLTLSAHFLGCVAHGQRLEDAIEQLAKTVLRTARCSSVLLEVQDSDGKPRRLSDLLGGAAPRTARVPPTAPTAMAVSGALSGKTIAVSPGHGYYWHSTLGWTTQRPVIDGLVEDIHTAEIANRYLIPALENMGARVISCRERGEIIHEGLADNDLGAAVYQSSGAWGTATAGGYQNRTYQTAWTSSTVTATATFTIPVPADGVYPVYAFANAVTNASTDARYTIHHSGGATQVSMDQRNNDRCWTWLGAFSFRKADGAKIVLDNLGPANQIVVADAVRIGGGVGSIARGSSGTSNKPRWQECSRYWTQFAGAPATVWDTTSGEDNNDDVTARPRYAEWRGADAYISLHTNAGGGDGTSSYIHNTAPSAGSARLQAAVHTQVVGDIRSGYDSTWTDRGQLTANFGEVRLLSTMPGVLLELAFHDVANSRDHRALHDPRFRYISGRAYARGVLRYFSNAPFPPEAPTALRVTQHAGRGLRVAWEAVSGATYYSIEQSPDGVGFVEIAQTSGTAWDTPALPHGSVLSFRVRAGNASGRSFPTETLTAGTSHRKRADVLLVQGFDRLDRYVKGPENTGNYLRRHAAAIRSAAQFSLGFDAASNEAVLLGRVRMGDYVAVDWACGEESTADETFSSAEQSLVTSYLQAGGRLLVSGAEVGWDLSAKGSAADRAFFENRIGATYVADDANTYGFRAAAGSHLFTGIPAGAFDNGSSGTYDVDYADVITPTDPKSQLCLVYSDGRGAAIQRIDGNSRVVFLGFPLECITDDALRAEIMVRALRFLLTPRPLEADPEVLLGNTLTLDVAQPNDAGQTYVLAAALRLGSIPLPVDHLVPLAADPVLELSLIPNPVFLAFRGTLDAAGRGQGRFAVPNLPVARGVDVYFSGMTADNTGAFRSVLPWVRTTIR
ncbi:MAG: N-acetylmuramoyl-L-alanine amidase [Planctomycetes bacterium]|nr:N-acetylmuramoyl-L-alanine amidase [Planctomycetota bacterium]